MNPKGDLVGLFGYTTLLTGIIIAVVAMLYRLARNLRTPRSVALSMLVTIVGALILALFVFVLVGVAIK